MSTTRAESLPPKAAVIMTKNLLAAELARILPRAEYVEMPRIDTERGLAASSLPTVRVVGNL